MDAIFYGLAKKLKDAGFPQKDRRGIPLPTICAKAKDGTNHDISECKDAATPSLSELIKACGDRFNTLRILSDGWQAFDNVYVDDDGFTARSGSTPEEAVANLWLALNPTQQ